MHRWTCEARNEDETFALGAALAEVLPRRAVIGLCGTLGAGKTRLVQAIAEACGIDRREVVSPTFVLAQEHYGRRTIYHLDAYRLRGPSEFLELGPEEYFERDAVTLIEWADRVPGCLPPDHLEIHIEVTGSESRRFVFIGYGESAAEVVRRLEVVGPKARTGK